MNDRPPHRTSELGFTLLEVLIALVILAVAAAGFANAGRSAAQQSEYLTLKTLASVVAVNKIREAQLSGVWPDTGRSDDAVDMAGRQWAVTTEVESTDVASLRRLNISVGLKNTDPSDTPLYQLTGFAGKH